MIKIKIFLSDLTVPLDAYPHLSGVFSPSLVDHIFFQVFVLLLLLASLLVLDTTIHKVLINSEGINLILQGTMPVVNPNLLVKWRDFNRARISLLGHQLLKLLILACDLLSAVFLDWPHVWVGVLIYSSLCTEKAVFLCLLVSGPTIDGLVVLMVTWTSVVVFHDFLVDCWYQLLISPVFLGRQKLMRNLQIRTAIDRWVRWVRTRHLLRKLSPTLRDIPCSRCITMVANRWKEAARRWLTFQLVL